MRFRLHPFILAVLLLLAQSSFSSQLDQPEFEKWKKSELGKDGSIWTNPENPDERLIQIIGASQQNLPIKRIQSSEFKESLVAARNLTQNLFGIYDWQLSSLKVSENATGLGLSLQGQYRNSEGLPMFFYEYQLWDQRKFTTIIYAYPYPEAQSLKEPFRQIMILANSQRKPASASEAVGPCPDCEKTQSISKELEKFNTFANEYISSEKKPEACTNADAPTATSQTREQILGDFNLFVDNETASNSAPKATLNCLSNVVGNVGKSIVDGLLGLVDLAWAGVEKGASLIWSLTDSEKRGQLWNTITKGANKTLDGVAWTVTNPGSAALGLLEASHKGINAATDLANKLAKVVAISVMQSVPEFLCLPLDKKVKLVCQTIGYVGGAFVDVGSAISLLGTANRAKLLKLIQDGASKARLSVISDSAILNKAAATGIKANIKTATAQELSAHVSDPDKLHWLTEPKTNRQIAISSKRAADGSQQDVVVFKNGANSLKSDTDVNDHVTYYLQEKLDKDSKRLVEIGKLKSSDAEKYRDTAAATNPLSILNSRFAENDKQFLQRVYGIGEKDLIGSSTEKFAKLLKEDPETRHLFEDLAASIKNSDDKARARKLIVGIGKIGIENDAPAVLNISGGLISEAAKLVIASKSHLPEGLGDWAKESLAGLGSANRVERKEARENIKALTKIVKDFNKKPTEPLNSQIQKLLDRVGKKFHLKQEEQRELEFCFNGPNNVVQLQPETCEKFLAYFAMGGVHGPN